MLFDRIDVSDQLVFVLWVELIELVDAELGQRDIPDISLELQDDSDDDDEPLHGDVWWDDALDEEFFFDVPR